jgi:hypothetical protein
MYSSMSSFGGGGSPYSLPAVEGAYVFGWTDDAPLQVDVSGPRGRRVTHTLLYAKVPLRSGQLLTGYVAGTAAGGTRTAAECYGQDVLMSYGQDSVELDFDFDVTQMPGEQLWLGLVGRQIGRDHLEVTMWYDGAQDWMPVGEIFATDVMSPKEVLTIGWRPESQVRLRLQRQSAGGASEKPPICGELRLYSRPPTQADLNPDA